MEKDGTATVDCWERQGQSQDGSAISKSHQGEMAHQEWDPSVSRLSLMASLFPPDLQDIADGLGPDSWIRGACFGRPLQAEV